MVLRFINPKNYICRTKTRAMYLTFRVNKIHSLINDSNAVHSTFEKHVHVQRLIYATYVHFSCTVKVKTLLPNFNR